MKSKKKQVPAEIREHMARLGRKSWLARVKKAMDAKKGKMNDN